LNTNKNSTEDEYIISYEFPGLVAFFRRKAFDKYQ